MHVYSKATPMPEVTVIPAQPGRQVLMPRRTPWERAMRRNRRSARGLRKVSPFATPKVAPHPWRERLHAALEGRTDV